VLPFLLERRKAGIPNPDLSAVRFSPLASPLMSREKTTSTGAADAEALRVRRLREDAQRPISVNLAETIALSHKLMRFAGAARRS